MSHVVLCEPDSVFLVLQSKHLEHILKHFVGSLFVLAYQTKVSVIFISADKSYLTYPYPNRGMHKNELPHVLSIHWLYKRSHNSVAKTLEVDVIATSHTTSSFKMAPVNVQERDQSTATPTLKSIAGDQKVCKKKPRDAKQ